MQTNDPVIFCADIGSVGKGNFAWACSEQKFADRDSQSSPSALANAVVMAIKDNRSVALGFECPLWLPLPLLDGDEKEIGQIRSGEDSYGWTAGAGACVMAQGLVQTAWVLSQLNQQCPEIRFETKREKCTGGTVLLWEAFITGKAKSGATGKAQHAKDAAIGVNAFNRAWENETGSELKPETKTQKPAQVFSLVAAALIFAGFKEDGVRLLKEPCWVIKP